MTVKRKASRASAKNRAYEIEVLDPNELDSMPTVLNARASTNSGARSKAITQMRKRGGFKQGEDYYIGSVRLKRNRG